MPIYSGGSLNTTALVVPNIYVQIVAPQNLVINGVPTNRVGVVGTATFGPVGVPTIVSSMADYARIFGAIQNRKYDAGTAVALAVLQGASDFRVVRVTDGTDTAASSTTPLGGATCLSITGLYTGTLGNSITAAVAVGSKANSFKITIGLPGQVPEVYDNLTGTGNAFWVAAAAAINAGSGVQRGPSQLVIASAGVGTVTPTAGMSVTLTGGTDGVGTITAATLVGLDTVPRKGMYALRSSGCSILVLADADDSTQYTTIDSLALFEGMYAIQVLPSGTTVATAVTTKASAGLDSYSSKLMHGDWLYWQDPTNQVLRLVSPQGFVAGRLANLSPQNSPLNKPLYGVSGSQKSGLAGSPQFATYSTADLTALFQAGIDVVANPQPGGTYWGCSLGHNSSSNAAVNGDNYTRMTNYIAATLNAGMGAYVGQLINVNLFRRIRSTLLSYFSNLLGQGLLGTLDGSTPYAVICDNTNNPQSRTSLGYVQSDCQVQYQGINERFIVNLEGGTTVVIQKQTTSAGQVSQ